jgi:hypothetical protein
MSEKSTAITVAERKENNMIPVGGIDDIKTLGKILGESGMFGCRNEAEAVMIAAMCHQDGISYSKWMDTNHMIQGRKSKRADAIHADFLRSGGRSKIKKRDADACIIVLTSKDGDEYEFSLTWADAIKEPFVYNGREGDVVAALIGKKTESLKIKDKYQTPRSRMQMLWARCISDGVRSIDPTCCQGVYTPEEVEDFIDVTPRSTTASTEDVKPRATPAKKPEPANITVEATAPTAPSVAPKKKEDFSAAEVVEPVAEVTPEPADARKKAKEAAQAAIKEQSKAVEPEKVAPVQAPAPPSATDDNEPTPFDDPVPAAQDDGQNYSVCPIEGRLAGKPWAEMTKDILVFAKQKYAASLSPRHIAEIDAQIKAKS